LLPLIAEQKFHYKNITKIEVSIIKTKPIFNSFLAKQLLHCGNPIVDLQKNHKLKNATVFFFEETEKFIQDLKQLTAE
jgi:hypothetical protein